MPKKEETKSEDDIALRKVAFKEQLNSLTNEYLNNITPRLPLEVLVGVLEEHKHRLLTTDFIEEFKAKLIKQYPFLETYLGKLKDGINNLPKVG